MPAMLKDQACRGLPTACLPLDSLLTLPAATAILLAELPALGAVGYVPSIVLGAYACGT